MIWDEVQVSVLFKSSPDDFHVQLGLRTTAPSAVDGKIKGLRKTWDRMSALPTNATADLKVFNTLALKVKIYPWGGGHIQIAVICTETKLWSHLDENVKV